MAKKNFSKGIDRVFSPTKIVETEDTSTSLSASAGEMGEIEKSPGRNDDKAVVSYNIRYSKELQKRIKRFCIEHDGIDMKDVFTRGAVMYMDKLVK